MTEDERYMQVALQVADLGRGQTSPNPLVGAVIVKDGEIVGQGAHLKAGTPHAEVHALRMAGDKADGATAYVTLEPCNHHGRTPPCSEALIRAKVKRVVVAATDPFPLVDGQGIARLREAGIEVVTGVLEDQALQQNEAFFTWARLKRPFVVWKAAATLDGYIATASGHSQFVSGRDARQSVQALRRSLSAIGVGIQTVLADNPRLTVRDETGRPSVLQPLRVLFDAKLRLPTDAACLREPGRSLVYTTESGVTMRSSAELETLRSQHVEIVAVPPDQSGRISLGDALTDLAERGCNSLLIEGGSQLASAFFHQRFVDKVVYYLAPKLLAGGLPALQGGTAVAMAEAVALDRVAWRQVGADLCVEGYPIYPGNPLPGTRG